MVSTLEHPLAFFDWYFKNEIDKDLKYFYSNVKEEYSSNIESIDKKIHSVRLFNIYHKEEINSDIIVWTFENSIKSKLNKEINHSIKLIESGFLNRFTYSNEIKAYADFLRIKIKMILQLKAFQEFDFLYSYIEKIQFVIDGYGYAEQPKTYQYTFSFVLQAENVSEQTIKIRKLYNLLTEPKPIINCTQENFISAFSGKEIEKGINWLVTGKSKLTSKGSLFYFLFELIDKGFLKREMLNDLNKYVEYVFRDKNGDLLKNLKQSKSTMSNSPAEKDRIDIIISSL